MKLVCTRSYSLSPLALAFWLVLAGFNPWTSTSTHAQNWTRFRGENGAGQSEAENIPSVWTEEDYNWKVDLPGLGNSSPVIWNEKLFIITGNPESGEQIIECRKVSDGSILWQRRMKSSAYHLHARNTYSSSTPSVDEDRVYVAWASPEKGTLKALDHDGKDVWEVELGPYYSQHGFGASPIVFGELVVLNIEMDKEGQSYLLAVNRKTGEQAWKIDRQTTNAAYSSPCLYTPSAGKPELIFNSNAHGITAIDPESGAINWEIDVFDKRSVSSPVVVGDLIFGSCGSGGGGNYVVAVQPGDRSGAKPELAYKIDKSAPYVPSVIAYKDLAFLWGDKGVITCLDVKTGEIHYQKRVGGNFSGSPIRIQDRLYGISDEGDCLVIAATKEFKELGRNSLGDLSRSTPAVANGRLYLRTQKTLVSLGGK
jgi:outer membrane protein assembly factor BamB